MDRYYNSHRSHSPPSQNHSNSRRNHIGNEPKNKYLRTNFEQKIQELPEYIPLSSNSQDSKSRHSDSDRSRSGRRSPPNQRDKSNRNATPPNRQQQREKESRRIIYDDNASSRSSSDSSKNRNRQKSRSPLHHRSRTNSLERINRSVHSRLGSKVINNDDRYVSDIPPPPSTNLRYENNSRSMEDYYQIHGRFSHRQEGSDMRIIVHNDQRAMPYQQQNETEEIIHTIRALEQQNEENYQHINGIKLTVENYQREISKLVIIVNETSKEIIKLKNRLSSIPYGYNF